MQHLVFAIESGELVWLAAHPTKEEAVAHINELRPDGTRDAEEPTGEARYEFAFTVESAHFASFV